MNDAAFDRDPAASVSAARRALLGRLGLACLSAILFGLAFPPTHWRWLAWIALVPFFAALRGLSSRQAALYSLVWTFAMGWTTSDWLPRAVSGYFEQPPVIGAAFFVAVVMTMGAPYYVLFGVAYPRLVERAGIATPWIVGAAWVTLEIGRGRLFNGTILYFGSTPWATLGYSQAGSHAIVQIADITGVYGVSFLLVAVNAALAEVVHALRRGSRSVREISGLVASGAFPAALALAYGAWTLAGAPDGPGLQAKRIAIIQGNLSLEARWQSDLYGSNLATYLELTLKALREGRVEVVFWPEAAMTFFLADEPAYRQSIGRVLAPFDAELIAGAPRTDGATPPTYWNSIYALDSRAEIRGRYDKRHLVPFMEYFPGGIDLLERSFGRIRVFEPGEPAPPFATRVGTLGMLVCNEAVLPHFAGDRVAEGATLLVNPSNDSWVPDDKFLLEMIDIISFRSIEQRRYLIRPSTSGPSAIVDPWGRIQQRSAHFSQDVLIGAVEASSQRSIYSRIGDAFSLLCCFATGAALLQAIRRNRTESTGASGAAEGNKSK